MKEKAFVIGLCGGSGSGKTSFLNAIRSLFDEDQICIISLDEYYRTIDKQTKDKQGIENFDLPESIDLEHFYQDVVKLIHGKTVQKQEYIFNNSKSDAKNLVFNPAPVLLIEGLFVYHHAQIRDLIDLKLFIHAKDELKIIRRINRDQKERNYPLEDVLYRYQYHVSPSYDRYIKPYKEMADLVINNNHHFDQSLQVIAAYIQNLLET